MDRGVSQTVQLVPECSLTKVHAMHVHGAAAGGGAAGVAGGGGGAAGVTRVAGALAVPQAAQMDEVPGLVSVHAEQFHSGAPGRAAPHISHAVREASLAKVHAVHDQLMVVAGEDKD